MMGLKEGDQVASVARLLNGRSEDQPAGTLDVAEDQNGAVDADAVLDTDDFLPDTVAEDDYDE